MTASRPSNDLLLSIGGVVGHLALRDAPPALVAVLRQRYDTFILPCAQGVDRAFSLEVRFTVEPLAHAPASVIPPAVMAAGDEVTVSRWDFEAGLSRRPASEGPLVGAGRCWAHAFSFDCLLRALWSTFLLRADGALFHACGVRRGELAVMAPGLSGAGKTTLARKVSAPDEVLNDETLAVRRTADGGWRVHGTPFFGDLGQGPLSLRSWPLAGIAFLAKRERVRARPLSLAEAVARAMECVVCFEAGPGPAERTLTSMISLCAEVPAFLSEGPADAAVPALFEAWRRHLRQIPVTAPLAREVFATMRAQLRKRGVFAFNARGGSMRPALRTGDTIFIERIDPARVLPGDVVVYWRPGRSPDRDQLYCHRVVFRRGARMYTKGDALSHVESFEDGRDAELIGRVEAVARNGETRRLPGRLASLGLLMGALLVAPLLRLVHG